MAKWPCLSWQVGLCSCLRIVVLRLLTSTAGSPGLADAQMRVQWATDELDAFMHDASSRKSRITSGAGN